MWNDGIAIFSSVEEDRELREEMEENNAGVVSECVRGAGRVRPGHAGAGDELSRLLTRSGHSFPRSDRGRWIGAMRTSENAPSTTLVNKGKKKRKGRSCYAPAPFLFTPGPLPEGGLRRQIQMSEVTSPPG
jgi:hypothetical protein